MKTYFSNKYGDYYIMCKDFDEVYSFNSFGNVVRRTGGVSSCNSWQEVGIISIVGGAFAPCEILCNGETAIIGESLVNIMCKIRDKGSYIGTVFSVPHEDDNGKFTQIIFIYPLHVNPKDIVNRIYEGVSWRKIF